MKEQKNLQDALTTPGIVPVIRLKSGEKLPRLLETFQQAGIRAVELTMTMPDAPGLLRENRRRFGDSLVIGMGTVTDEITAQQALDSGAQFLVSPFPVTAALTLAKTQNVPMVMGAFFSAGSVYGIPSGGGFRQGVSAECSWLELSEGSQRSASGSEIFPDGRHYSGTNSGIVQTGRSRLRCRRRAGAIRSDRRREVG